MLAGQNGSLAKLRRIYRYSATTRSSLIRLVARTVLVVSVFVLKLESSALTILKGLATMGIIAPGIPLAARSGAARM